jgi:hypothetical protein
VRFKQQHTFFPEAKYQDFEHDKPPPWMISKDYKWWYDAHVLTLKVGETVESDFRRITRVS